MASQNEDVTSKQKLTDEEKSILIEFFKEHKPLWSTEKQFSNKQLKVNAKEKLSTLFDGKYSLEYLKKLFMLYATVSTENLKSIMV